MISGSLQPSLPAILASLCVLAAVVLPSTTAGPIVSTKHGLVEGSRRLFSGQVYEEFLGIPFAQPPVGPLRWAKPQPVEAWEGVRDATKYSKHCPQYLTVLYPFVGIGGEDGEDCLYANVWVPRGVEANQGRQLPVMVFAYGGAFVFGTGEMYPGYGLALHGDVIVVNFNYRLDVLGWFSTGDAVAPGNFGLWDLEAVLVWVQENIGQFAGDPGKVTIFGQSAGAGQVSMATVSPKTRGLFHNAIAISGSAFANYDEKSLDKAAMLAEAFGCPTQSSAAIVACLRDVPEPYELLFWYRATVLAAYGSGFSPIVDGDIMPIPSKEAFLLGYGRGVNFMNGYTFHDYAGFMIGNPIALPILGDRGNWAATNESCYTQWKRMMRGATNADQLIEEIYERYPGMNVDDVTVRSEAAARATTDWSFGSGVNWEAIAQSSLPDKQRGVYTYQFHHRFSFLVGYPDWVNGSHMDDIYGSLGEPFFQTYRRIYLRHDYDDVDLDVMNNIMNYYANFAYTGNPNEGPLPVPVAWDEFDPDLQNYLHQAPTFSVEQFSTEAVDNFRFWNDFWSRAEFPPPEEKSTSEINDFSKGENVAKRASLTEEDISRGVEEFRNEMRQLLTHAGLEEMIVVMETRVNDMVARRLERLKQRIA